MKGDFTRDTFDPRRHFSRVLMQQGRVQLDADWNEQQAITLHYLRALNVDLMGEHWGTVGSFDIQPSAAGTQDYFSIAAGHYYVNGILCANHAVLKYRDQPGFGSIAAPTGGQYVVYLDVWERHVGYVEHEGIREVALAGLDTATRAQTVWQVKLLPLETTNTNALCDQGQKLLTSKLVRQKAPELKARAKKPAAAGDACSIPPESKYRGPENQLYRVEVHQAGTVQSGATFKWSRENGSVVFPVVSVDSGDTEIVVTLAHFGRDDRSTLAENDRVELVDDTYVLWEMAEPLCRVKKIDRLTMTVTLEVADPKKISAKVGPHKLLRRWDHEGATSPDGAELVVESSDAQKDWIELEDGVAVQFQAGQEYRTGDYWLIPARTATGDVEWPVDDTTRLPLASAARGVQHHYAPLAVVAVAGNTVTVSSKCRREVSALWKPA